MAMQWGYSYAKNGRYLISCTSSSSSDSTGSISALEILLVFVSPILLENGCLLFLSLLLVLSICAPAKKKKRPHDE